MPRIVPLGAVLAALALPACAPSAGGGAPAAEPVQPRLVGGAIRIGGCPQVNIGTAANPRFVKDPACGAGD